VSAAFRIVAAIDGVSYRIEEPYQTPGGFMLMPGIGWRQTGAIFKTVEEAEVAIKRVVNDRGRYYDAHGRPF
jgi:hypothetical protein